jgi:hypothetical protein
VSAVLYSECPIKKTIFCGRIDTRRWSYAFDPDEASLLEADRTDLLVPTISLGGSLFALVHNLGLAETLNVDNPNVDPCV